MYLEGKQYHVIHEFYSFNLQMLVVFKSAPILKRTLKVKHAMLQLYVLKLLKMQTKYLGRQWRKSNMKTMSAIYTKVRHRLNDDWAYGNGKKTLKRETLSLCTFFFFNIQTLKVDHGISKQKDVHYVVQWINLTIGDTKESFQMVNSKCNNR